MSKNVDAKVRMLGLGLSRLAKVAENPESSMDQVAHALHEMVDPTQLFLKRLEASGLSLAEVQKMNSATALRVQATFAEIGPETFKSVIDSLTVQGKTTYEAANKAFSAERSLMLDLVKTARKETPKMYGTLTGTWTEAMNKMSGAIGQVADELTTSMDDLTPTLAAIVRKSMDETGRGMVKAVSSGYAISAGMPGGLMMPGGGQTQYYRPSPTGRDIQSAVETRIRRDTIAGQNLEEN